MPSSLRSGKIICTDGYQLPSLPNFFFLPRELQARCLSIACQSSEMLHEEHTVNDHQTAVERKTATKTLKSLMLSSRSLNAIVTPIVYASVKVDRPSVLAELVRTLQGNPSLGKLIKRLHLGTTSSYICHSWQLEHLKGNRYFNCLNLRDMATTLEDLDVLPRWCCPRRVWDIARRSSPLNWRDKAVLDALAAAASDLDVDLLRPRYSAAGIEIGADAWLIGVVEAQAALDLYLTHMRKVEDAEGQPVEEWEGRWGADHGPKPAGPATKYPPLKLRTRASSVTLKEVTDADRPFQLSRADLLRHLARRGSPTDRFDHPLIFARSSRQMMAIDDHGRAGNIPDFAARLELLYGQGVGTLSSPSFDLHAPTVTINSALSLCHRLLALTPDLRDLHLSDFLQLLICSLHRRELPVRSLRTLHLGPFPGCEPNCLAPTSKGSDLDFLEELYLVGCTHAERKVAIIAALPRLKKVRWDMKTETDDYPGMNERQQTMLNTILLLQQALDASPATSPAAAAGQKRSRSAYEDEREGEEARGVAERVAAAMTHRPRLVEVILYDSNIDAMLPLLPSEEVRGEWKQGQSLCREPHRLHLRLE